VKVLATRRYPGPAFDELADLEVVPLGSITAPRPEVDALVVANEPPPLELLPGVRIVANFGVGYDRIDIAACTERGVVVTNTPGVLDAATADLAMALILAVRRRVVEGDQLVRSGRWTGSWADSGLAEELTGSTLGIVGLGRIGKLVAEQDIVTQTSIENVGAIVAGEQIIAQSAVYGVVGSASDSVIAEARQNQALGLENKIAFGIPADASRTAE